MTGSSRSVSFNPSFFEPMKPARKKAAERARHVPVVPPRALEPQSLESAADASKSERADVLRQLPEHDASLVAGIAARLLRSDGYHDAVERALRLLDATAEGLLKRDDLRARAILGQCERADVPAHLDFLRGIKFITGHTRRDRAEKDWLDFLSYSIRGSKICEADFALPPGQLDENSIPATTPAEVTKVQRRQEQQGFSAAQLDSHRRMFRRWKKNH